jgi:hypothetical protein
LFLQALLFKLLVNIKLSLLVIAQDLVEFLLAARCLEPLFVLSKSVDLVNSKIVFNLLLLSNFIGLYLVQFHLHVLLDLIELFIKNVLSLRLVVFDDNLDFCQLVFKLLATGTSLFKSHLEEVVLAVFIGMHQVLDVLHLVLEIIHVAVDLITICTVLLEPVAEGLSDVL